MAANYQNRQLPSISDSHPYQQQNQHQPQQQSSSSPAPSQHQERRKHGGFALNSRRRKAQNQIDRSEVGICTKYMLFFENCIMFLMGAGLVAIGAYILSMKQKTLTDPLDFFLDPACVMCLAGALTFALAFLGCTGALRENTSFLKLFYYILSLFLLLEVAAAICFFVMYYVPSARSLLFPQNSFNAAIVKYREDKDMQNLIDSIQRTLGCCGLTDSETGYEDWNKNPYFNCTTDNLSPEKCSVPPSCCKMIPGEMINLFCGAKIYNLENGQRTTSDTSRIYTDGCLKALGNWVNDNSLIVGGVLLGILLPQIFIICMARNLLDMINRQKRKWKTNR